jgi:DnaJ-class molecular chaperone
MGQDPYKILGVSRAADAQEIRRAHRRLAKRYHPDVAGGGAGEKFRAVQDAYDILMDPEKRGAFDRSRMASHKVPESPASQSFAARPASRSDHLDLRNLNAHPHAEPIFSRRQGMAPPMDPAADPWDEIRRCLHILDEWFPSGW